MQAEEYAVRVPIRDRTGAVVAYALVDDADAERVLALRWHLSSNGYVRTTLPRSVGGDTHRHPLLHRFLFGLQHGDPREVDHRNHDPLDNRRANLRVGTKADNMQNRRGAARHSRSGARGVIWQRGRWRARAVVDGREHYLGVYVDIDDAAAAVDAFWKSRAAAA